MVGAWVGVAAPKTSALKGSGAKGPGLLTWVVGGPACRGAAGCAPKTCPVKGSGARGPGRLTWVVGACVGGSGPALRMKRNRKVRIQNRGTLTQRDLDMEASQFFSYAS